MRAIRKKTTAFADFKNREWVDVHNQYSLCCLRFNHERPSEQGWWSPILRSSRNIWI